MPISASRLQKVNAGVKARIEKQKTLVESELKDSINKFLNIVSTKNINPMPRLEQLELLS